MKDCDWELNQGIPLRLGIQGIKSELNSCMVPNNDLKFISTPVDEHSIGIAISYRVLLHNTIVRLLESLNESDKFI